MDYKEKVIALLNSQELSKEQKEKLEDIFPELKESEDEKVGKALINGFNKLDKSAVWYNGITNSQILAWLEKQGEQKLVSEMKTPEESLGVDSDTYNKIVNECIYNIDPYFSEPTDKVEPKFRIGDTVTVKPMSCHGKVFKGEPFKIVDIIEDNYVSDNGKTYSISLQDGWELVEQKSAWSEEDDEHLERILKELESQYQKPINRPYLDKIESDYNWLKSFKDRHISQTKQGWSEEDERKHNRLIHIVEDTLETFDNTGLNDNLDEQLIPWLKSLNLRISGSRVMSR